MEQLEIRLATLLELDDIVEMIGRDSVVPFESRTREEYIAAFEEMTGHPDNALVVAMLGKIVAGTLQLTFIPGLKSGWRAQVEAVRVREDLRNLQIGSQMMQWVIERARERGCYLLQLTTNLERKDAQRFYGRLGFEATHVGMKLYL
jgi:GNAT superfamily N-acetyltransferase